MTVHSEDIGDTEPGMLAAVLYNRKAGIEPALQFLARGSVYRLPPVLFAIHAPPGRDRLGGCSQNPEAWSLQAFFSAAVISADMPR